MTDANTGQAVECPICGEEFDPTVAGGWCTNTDCGEWQYTETASADEDAADEDGLDPDEDAFVSPAETDADESDPVDLFSDEGSADESEADVADDAYGAVEDNVEADAEVADDAYGAVEDNVEADEAVADDAYGAVEDNVEADEAVADDAYGAVEDNVDEGDEGADAEPAGSDVEGHTDEGGEVADDAADAGEDNVEADAEVADDAYGAVEDNVEADAEVADDAYGAVEDNVDEGGDADDTGAEAEPDEAATIDCPDCGAELGADANFCVECGADVSAVTPGEDELDACPGCGSDVEPEDNFCVNCGEDLAAHREAGQDHEDAIDALEANGDDEAPESLVLEVAGREIPVADGDTVGREIRAALTEAGRPDDEAVRIHREHVRFVHESGRFYLLDLGDNPTQLNGESLQKGDREAVAPGDELELSGVASVSVRAP